MVINNIYQALHLDVKMKVLFSSIKCPLKFEVQTRQKALRLQSVEKYLIDKSI